MTLYLLRIDGEEYLGEFSFESERARDAFVSGWCYARAGEDPTMWRAEERTMHLWEVEAPDEAEGSYLGAP